MSYSLHYKTKLLLEPTIISENTVDVNTILCIFVTSILLIILLIIDIISTTLLG